MGTQTANPFGSIPRRHFNRRAICRGQYDSSRLSRVYQLNLNDPIFCKINRAGVIYYTYHQNKLYFCFGRDRMSQDLTDFGGGRKSSETPIECAVREANEESRFIFGELTSDLVQWFYCLYNRTMLIIFIQVAVPSNEDIFEVTRQNFTSGQMVPSHLTKMKDGNLTYDRCLNEVSEIVWVPADQVQKMLTDSLQSKIYSRVRRFILSCQNLHLAFKQLNLSSSLERNTNSLN